MTARALFFRSARFLCLLAITGCSGEPSEDASVKAPPTGSDGAAAASASATAAAATAAEAAPSPTAASFAAGTGAASASPFGDTAGAVSAPEMAPEVRVAEPTVHAIGFEWDTADVGDPEHHVDPEHRFARGLIRFRRHGSSEWKYAPLLRVDHQGWTSRCLHDFCCKDLEEDICGKDGGNQTLSQLAATCCAEGSECSGGIPCAELGKDDDDQGLWGPKRAEGLASCREVQCPSEHVSNVERQTRERGYRRFNMFAGSLMNLDPGTKYVARLLVCDHGQTDDACNSQPVTTSEELTVSTLPRPRRPYHAGGFHVVSDDECRACEFVEEISCACARNPDHEDCKAPCDGCKPRCDGSKAKPFQGFAEADRCAKPGDLFLVHPGGYFGHVFEPLDANEPAADGTFLPPSPDNYVYWVGVESRIVQEKAATTPADGKPVQFACPKPAEESPYALTRVRLRARRDDSHPDDGVGSLVVQRDNLWFEGFDLAPAAPSVAAQDERDYRGLVDGIVGGVRSPAKTLGEDDSLQDDPIQPFGTRNVVIVRNSFADFNYAVSTGKWCSGESLGYEGFKGSGAIGVAKGIAWNADQARLRKEICVEPAGLPAVEGASNTELDKRRDHMHRHWYIGDNVFHGTHTHHRYAHEKDASGKATTIVGCLVPDLVALTFTADSDVAFNRFSMTSCRKEWTDLAKASWKNGGLVGDDLTFPLQCSLEPDSWPSQAECLDGETGCQPKESDKCRATQWICPHADLPSGPACLCPHSEPDAIMIQSSTNVDIYGNDARDIPGDNFVHAGSSLANLRIWRNRAVNVGHNLVRMDPMHSAPWYIVRNEFVGHGPPLGFQIFDRFFLINNTFVLTATSGQGEAEGMFGAYSRNNLWIHRFRRAGDGMRGGYIWAGRPTETLGTPTHHDGQSFADWRTSLDYDGFDWGAMVDGEDDDLVDAGDCEARYLHGNTTSAACSSLTPRGTESDNKVVLWGSAISWSATDGFRSRAKGCSGGAKARACSTADECLPFKCDAIEPNMRRVDRAEIFALCKKDPVTGEPESDCESALEHYRFRDRFPDYDLALAGDAKRRCAADYRKRSECGSDCSIVHCQPCGLDVCQCDGGGKTCDSDDECRGSVDADGEGDVVAQCLDRAIDGGVRVPHLAEVTTQCGEQGVPDLGAHEYRVGYVPAHYGPRTRASAAKGEDPAY